MHVALRMWLPLVPKLLEPLDNIGRSPPSLQAGNSLQQQQQFFVSQTWLTANIGDSELYLCNFNIYCSEREPTEEVASRHGGALIAVNKNIKSEQLNLKLPNCCVAVQLQLLKPIVLCIFYNPPRGSTYRYTFEDFNILVNSLLKKNTPIVVCGDINFPNTNWDTNQSIDTEENNMLN